MANKIQKFISRQQMVRTDFEIHHYHDSYLKEVALHHHDFYEIYLFLNGDVQYSIESRNYHLLPGDILLISPLELHQPRIAQEKSPYERIVLWIDKPYIEQFSTPQTDLTRCFDTSLETHTNLLRLPPKQCSLAENLMESLASAADNQEYGEDLLTFSYLIQLLVEVNRQIPNALRRQEPSDQSNQIVADILGYINDHYQEPLSLDLLARRFFISKYHLSHEFKRLVGTSVHRYIIQKRLVIAKQMLSEPLPSTKVCRCCGFSDYTNFYRAFKTEYGISPTEFNGARKCAK